MRQILKRTVSTPPPLLATGRGEPGRRGRGTKLVVETYDCMTDRPRLHGPSLGPSRACDGHQPLHALWLKPSNETTAKSEERQEVEAGSRSSKTKRQQMKHLLFPGEFTLQLCSTGHCSQRWVSGHQSSYLNTHCCLEPTTCGQNKTLLFSRETSWQRKETIGT